MILKVHQFYRKLLEYNSPSQKLRRYEKLRWQIYSQNLGEIGEDSTIDVQAYLKGHTQNIFLGSKVKVRTGAILDCDRPHAKIHIGDRTIIQPYALVSTQKGFIKIGHDCSVNSFCSLYGHGGLTIGNYVRIATQTAIIPANHIFEDPDIRITKQGQTKEGITIEDDVWIGAGVKILDGCTIGKGSVIGAGTVLTKSVEPYSVVVGVPGRVIRKRGAKDKCN